MVGKTELINNSDILTAFIGFTQNDYRTKKNINLHLVFLCV